MKEDINNFIEEQTKLNPVWVKERRLEYLKYWLEICEKSEQPLIKAFNKFNETITKENEWFIDVLRELDKPILKKKRKILAEIKAYESPKYIGDKITEQMIENARNYPITDLIETNKEGFAICPFHNDKNPSAFCKNNYLFCFSCNTQADSIKLYQHLNHCNFIEAIKKLNNLQ